MQMKSKIWTILLAVAIAIVCWFYVVSVVSPNSDMKIRDIKVGITGEGMIAQNDLMVTNADELSRVELHLEGNRIDLNKLNSDNIKLTVDVSGISQPGPQYLPYSIVFPGDVASNAFVVLNKSPGSVLVQVERKITKEVDVQIRYANDVPIPYVADKDHAMQSPQKLIVSGPESVINQIDVAWVNINLENRQESYIDQNFPFVLATKEGKAVDSKHVTVKNENNEEVKEIKLSLDIGQVREIALGVNLIPGGGATVEDCMYVLTTEKIQVFGSAAAISALEEKLVDGKLILGDVELGRISNTNNAKTFELTLPEGLRFWKQETITDVRVTLAFPELMETTLNVHNFNIVGVPEGLYADVITTELKNVILRGDKDIIPKLTEENVVAEVDFTDATVDTKRRTVTFKYNDIVLGVVVLDPEAEDHYDVTVHVSKDTLSFPLGNQNP